MNIFLHPDLWVEYFNSRSQITQSELHQLLNQAIVNSNNRFLYNHNWENALKEVFLSFDSDEFNLFDVFSNTIIELNDKGRLIDEVTPCEIGNLDLLLKHLLDGTVAHTIFLKKEPENIVSNEFSIFDKVIKLNKHWISYSLASECGKDGTRLSPTDFNSNQQIADFYFDLLNHRWLNKKRIYVRTDYLHFGPAFEKIKSKKITVCTTNLQPNKVPKSQSEKSTERSRTRSELNNSVSIKYCSDRSELHQRTILSENIIIRQDHDFQEVNCSNNNWNITFFYCELEFSSVYRVLDENYS